MSVADVAVRFALTEKPGWFEERFLPRTRRDEATGCLLWTGAPGPGGYGVVTVSLPGRVNPVPMTVQRVAYAHAHGVDALPRSSRSGYSKFVVTRTCGTLACVEPTHLVLTSALAVEMRRYKEKV